MDPPKELMFGNHELIAKTIDALISRPQGQNLSNDLEIFVTDRLKHLEQTAVPKEISILNGTVNGFIHPDSEIKPTMFVDGFKLDDPEVYKSLLQEINEIKHSTGWENMSIREIAPMAIFRTQAKYFGNYCGDSTTGSRRREFYMDRSSATSEAFSVKELKSQQIAECIEKAALSQNLLTFLGYDSSLIMSSQCELTPGNKELHAFNIIKTERGNFITDFTNPTIMEDENQHVVNFLPNAYPISIEQQSALLQGGKVNVDHYDISIINGQSNKQPPIQRIYGGP